MLPIMFAVLVAATTSASVCDPTTWHQGYGSTSHKYKTVQCVENPCNATLCCQMCANDARCGHFVVKKDGCNFKTGAPNLTASADLITGVPQRVPTPSPTPPPTPPPTPVVPPPLGFQPHIIFFLADDFGHYNMGWRGNKEARTPNMDRLVQEGLVLDRHYVYQFCSPTRSSFLSGRLPIHINTKNMAPTAFGGVDPRASTIADKLKSAGYETHQTGKWNAGSRLFSQTPTMRGFDSAFGYMSGEEDHYTQVGGYKLSANYMPADLLETSYTAGEELAGLYGGGEALIDLLENGTPALGKNGTYGAFMYAARTVSIIEAHDPATPLFVYHAWQEVCSKPDLGMFCSMRFTAVLTRTSFRFFQRRTRLTRCPMSSCRQMAPSTGRCGAHTRAWYTPWTQALETSQPLSNPRACGRRRSSCSRP